MACRPLAVVFAFSLISFAWAQAPANRLAPAVDEVPPLPFRYVGRLVQNGKVEVLIMRGGLLYSVAEGDEIDGEYRIERITRAAVAFTYLPRRMKQNLDLAGATR